MQSNVINPCIDSDDYKYNGALTVSTQSTLTGVDERARFGGRRLFDELFRLGHDFRWSKVSTAQWQTFGFLVC